MRLLKLFAAALLLVTFSAHSASLQDYLPDDVTYDPSIPTPKEVLGYEVGEWHVRHDQLVRYMEILAEKSDRFELEVTGRTHQARPLLLVTITTPENHKNIEALRDAHLAIADPARKGDPETAPLVLYMGYSIHGDEPSGSNAALLYAYYLAAAQGEKIEAVLRDSIILLDPSLNPDGLARFAHWANQHRSENLVADPQHREHVQGTPRGRVNHYWFDLNRDWLLLQHPESRARIANFQKWKPNVLTDFHEMGTNSTFFFQPGIPTRRNPYTPDENVTLTGKLADDHAAALDEQGHLYFTEEAFDDFYVGKGSTYPDVQGAIGILFEQASSRGHAQDSINGVVKFPFTIQNQLTTSLTTMYGAHASKAAFLDYQQRFFDEALELADDADFNGYLIGENNDPARLAGLLEILDQHDIQVYPITSKVTENGVTYTPGSSYYVPLEQPQYRLIRAIFSTQQNFRDNTFYDVSGWTLPLAFNVNFASTDARVRHSDQRWQDPETTSVALAANAYAYGFDWHSYFAPRALQELLAAGVYVRQADESFTAKVSDGTHAFAQGAVVVTRANQQKSWQEVQELVLEVATRNNIAIHSITSGLTPEGIDLGSRNLRPVEPVKVMMLVGDGANMYENGEAWYYLDRHVSIPLSMIDTDRFNRIDLQRYTHIIMVDGSYRTLNDRSVSRLRDWVRDGGTVIGQQGGAKWLAENELLAASFVDDSVFDEKFDSSELSYADRDSYYGKRRVAGAIFGTELDLSHPLTFGFPRSKLPIFKDSLNAMEVPESPFITVARYLEEPLLSGYAAKENREVISEKAAIVAHRYGGGRVIGFADDVNFRAFFWGTAKLLSNAIFTSPAIDAYPQRDEDEAAAAAEAAEAAH
ncbi:M14 family zinc carboxypeptidase [Pseudidiomarina insulisalsae]|uniref:Peptidase M14 n=1 Tax=Pseudidiomarina insulisalsae TaxID=575789 RepID=A0A432YPN4_9GAMM|nr:M14 family zinc carboxypeptidase [Pseudidiomarina insulisalsae]RUO63023.1 peptidase M14 [Pseudidiomarina insulisalsae]